MEHVHIKNLKTKRITVIIFSFLFLLALVIEASCEIHTTKSWFYLGSSIFSSLIFWLTGSLVLLYASSKRIASIIFCFSIMMAFIFASELGSNNNSWLESITGIVSNFAIPVFMYLLRIIAQNSTTNVSYNSLQKEKNIRIFIIVVFILAFLLIIFKFILLIITKGHEVDWISSLSTLYDLLGFFGVVYTAYYSYNRLSSLRSKQQLRLVFLGAILCVAPILLLTILPTILNWDALDAQISSITVGIFPLFLAYSVLRYQFLVLDMHIRKAVAWAIGVILLASFVYIVVALCDVFISRFTLSIVFLVCATTAIASPFIWWLAKIISERLFFNEVRHYLRLVNEPTTLGDELIDVERAAQMITSAAIHTFGTSYVCLFVLEEHTGCYRLMPSFNSDPVDDARRSLSESLVQILKPQHIKNGHDDQQLEIELPAIQHLANSRRPMLLSEAIRSDEDKPGAIRRFLNTSSPLGDEDWLLAPVRSQGNMTGILVLGERGDQQAYAGPDFEIAQLLLARFSSMLETARMYAHANRHTALLNNLYAASVMPEDRFKTVQDALLAYAIVAANAAAARAEIWLYDSEKKTVRRVVVAGSGPTITADIGVLETTDEDWHAWFFDGDEDHNWNSSQTPACLVRLSQAPHFPLAWLPLQKDQQKVGIMILSYAHPHHFIRAETRVWEMFTNQCAVTIQNVRMTHDLIAAYDKQKELDILKDQFIMIASHELRTPLTAVQGYIELLSEFTGKLPSETQAEFVEKARLGCDELTLLVNNITDASHVQTAIDDINLQPLLLSHSITHVLGILDTSIRREQRTIINEIDPALQVVADETRLRQVLLNLVTNALRYSPSGTPIEISAQLVNRHNPHVQIAVRDYGLGVPLLDQTRLFERFVRLERDMNSSVRGAGLGLYICKQLVEAMNGNIWVESSGIKGEGSRFAFVLQLASRDQSQESSALSLPV